MKDEVQICNVIIQLQIKLQHHALHRKKYRGYCKQPCHQL